MSATKTAAGLCPACSARRSAAAERADEYTARSTPEAPDVTAEREHRMTITAWAACTGCSGRTR